MALCGLGVVLLDSLASRCDAALMVKGGKHGKA